MTVLISQTATWGPSVVPADGDEYNSADCYVSPHESAADREQYLYSATEAFSGTNLLSSAGANLDTGPIASAEVIAAGVNSTVVGLNIPASDIEEGDTILLYGAVSIGATPTGNSWLCLYDNTLGAVWSTWEHHIYDSAGGDYQEWAVQVAAYKVVIATEALNGLAIRLRNTTNSAGNVDLYTPYELHAHIVRH